MPRTHATAGTASWEMNSLPSMVYGKVMSTGEVWSLAFVGLAVVALIGHTASGYGFGVAEERLTRRLREVGFR